MVQVFCGPECRNEDGTMILSGENFHHAVQVMRLHVGDEFSVYYTGETAEYRYGIEQIGPDAAIGRLYFVKESDVELPSRITVLQGLPKSDKMETVIQKTIELGAARVVPVTCHRSVMKLDDKKAASRKARWDKIAEAAAAQSHRAFIPEVDLPKSFAEAVKIGAASDIRLIPYELAGGKGAQMEDTRNLIRSIRPGQSVSILIGPEGGFSEEEVQKAQEAGFVPVTLGHRILRTETAAMTVLSWLVLQLEQ
ncbi:MAG: 16S rRNA (uracil(1498)-N(3))-methyltransferase [Lachnospiraceae bacterium]|nr:16S rRNA (uracil(1498)-N(3))-methyltransferase [Lachnospiraceae bacterium]